LVIRNKIILFNYKNVILICYIFSTLIGLLQDIPNLEAQLMLPSISIADSQMVCLLVITVFYFITELIFIL